MSPGEAPPPEVRAARAAAEKARKKREEDPALMAAYQEQKRKEEEARLERKEKEDKERAREAEYDKWKTSDTGASVSYGAPTRGRGWFWVFFGLDGRLEQRRYFISTVILLILFVASLHYVLSTHYDSEYFDLYLDLDHKIPFWLGFLWAWVIFGYPAYAITSKRLADIDLEPMLALGFQAIIIIPVLGPILQAVACLALMVTPGIEGSNIYGSEPKASVDVRNAGPGKEGWYWLFFSVRGRLEQRWFVIASLSMGAVFFSVVHYTFWAGVPFLGIESGGNYFYLYDDPTGSTPGWYGFFWSWVIFGYPQYALVTKRLMDFEAPPQIALVFVFIIIIILIGPLLQLGMWVWLVAMPGTEGDNKFGPESQASVHARIYG
jgi:uncharacterized membrane protein YhaH (DUF805 family)